jgi:hypothetical protein
LNFAEQLLSTGLSKRRGAGKDQHGGAKPYPYGRSMQIEYLGLANAVLV